MNKLNFEIQNKTKNFYTNYYTDLYDVYKKPSRTKINIFYEWFNTFNENNIKFCGICSYNSMMFSLLGEDREGYYYITKTRCSYYLKPSEEAEEFLKSFKVEKRKLKREINKQKEELKKIYQAQGNQIKYNTKQKIKNNEYNEEINEEMLMIFNNFSKIHKAIKAIKTEDIEKEKLQKLEYNYNNITNQGGEKLYEYNLC